MISIFHLWTRRDDLLHFGAIDKALSVNNK